MNTTGYTLWDLKLTAVALYDLNYFKSLYDQPNGANSDINHLHQGYTILDVAAYNGRYRIVRYLISKGANVNLINGFHVTSLYFGITNNYVKVVKLLLRRGANMDLIEGMKDRYINACRSVEMMQALTTPLE